MSEEDKKIGGRSESSNWLTGPFSMTLVGIGALSVALFLASRPVTRLLSSLDDDGYDVENYDVVIDRPFIYSICE
jgi:hypothetical protein